MQANKLPFHRHPLLVTSNSEEFGEAVVSQYGATRAYAHVRSGFEGRINALRLPQLSMTSMWLSNPTLATFPGNQTYRQRFVLSGSVTKFLGRNAIQVAEGQSAVIGPGVATENEASSNYRQFILTIAQAAVENKLAAMLGRPTRGKIEVSPFSEFSRKHEHVLRSLLFFIADQTHHEAAPVSPILLDQLQEAIIVAFLTTNSHSFSKYLHDEVAPAVPANVLVAEEYIDAHLDRHVSIEELARVAGVSVRSLFRTFQSHRNCTPHAFSKLRRLNKAKAELEAGDPASTVTGIALKYGFQNGGKFAHDFAEAFGELPSDTLQKARHRH